MLKASSICDDPNETRRIKVRKPEFCFPCSVKHKAPHEERLRVQCFFFDAQRDAKMILTELLRR